MPIDPNLLQQIADPTGGKLGQIGQTLAKNRQLATENRRAETKLNMEEQLFDMKKTEFDIDQKLGQVSFMGDTALSMKAYYDSGGDEQGATELWEAHRKDAESLGYSMPDKAPDSGMVEGLATKSKQYVNYLNATKESNSAKKWQVIASIAAVPESKRTEEQKRMFEALLTPTMISGVSQPTTQQSVIAKNFIKSAKKGDIALEGEIEGEKGYRSEVQTRALAIQTEARYKNKAVSLTEAMTQAHEELQYKLVETDAFEVAGYAPFSKKFIYNPDAKLSPEDTGDAIGNPSDLKEGESGIYGGFEFMRENGKLKKRKVE